MTPNATEFEEICTDLEQIAADIKAANDKLKNIEEDDDEEDNAG